MWKGSRMLLLGSCGMISALPLPSTFQPQATIITGRCVHAFLAQLGAGITSKRRQILVNHIEERGGQVYSPAPKVAPLFAAAAKRKREELPSDLTHIICDERYDHAHASKILADAGVDALPEKVKVRDKRYPL